MTILEQIDELDNELCAAEEKADEADTAASNAEDEADSAARYAADASMYATNARDYAQSCMSILSDARQSLDRLKDTVVAAQKQGEDTKARAAALTKAQPKLTDAQLTHNIAQHMANQPAGRTRGEKIASVASMMYMEYADVAEHVTRAETAEKCPA